MWLRAKGAAARTSPDVAYVVSAGEYDDVRGLAVFADRGAAVAWAGRWERTHGDLPEYDRVTSVVTLPFVSAGAAAPDPMDLPR